jgi:two-component system cell cycle sensor histidine kinase/response regulator CckA
LVTLVFRDVASTGTARPVDDEDAVSADAHIEPADDLRDPRRARKLEAVGRMATGVAHDFNNLLLVIAGNAELALASDGTDVREELAEILRATDHARELVRQLLAFSRTETGPLVLNDLVLGARRMLDRLLGDAVDIHLELTDADTTVFGDSVQLERVLLNLGVNAGDAMQSGGRLTIATEREHDMVVLRMLDTGAGMSDQTLGQAFDPFFTTKTLGAGTGLGLTSVYSIVTNSGGDVAVDSQPGRGTTFTLRFPHRGGHLLQNAA